MTTTQKTQGISAGTVLVRRQDGKRFAATGRTEAVGATDFAEVMAVEGKGCDLVAVGASGLFSNPVGVAYDVEVTVRDSAAPSPFGAALAFGRSVLDPDDGDETTEIQAESMSDVVDGKLV
jgi:hypothetical protein